jgi:hypothetical protein
MRCSAPEPGDRLQCLCPERTVDAQQTRRMHDMLAVGPVIPTCAHTCQLCHQVTLLSRFNGVGYTFVLAGFLKIMTVGGLSLSAPTDVARTAFGKATPYLMVPVGLAMCWAAKTVGTHPLCIHYAYTCTHAIPHPPFLHRLHSLVVGASRA